MRGDKQRARKKTNNYTCTQFRLAQHPWANRGHKCGKLPFDCYSIFSFLFFRQDGLNPDKASPYLAPEKYSSEACCHIQVVQKFSTIKKEKVHRFRFEPNRIAYNRSSASFPSLDQTQNLYGSLFSIFFLLGPLSLPPPRVPGLSYFSLFENPGWTLFVSSFRSSKCISDSRSKSVFGGILFTFACLLALRDMHFMVCVPHNRIVMN